MALPAGEAQPRLAAPRHRAGAAQGERTLSINRRHLTFDMSGSRRQGASGPHFILGPARPPAASRLAQTLGAVCLGRKSFRFALRLLGLARVLGGVVRQAAAALLRLAEPPVSVVRDLSAARPSKSVWQVSLRRARLLCPLSASRFVGISPESLLYRRGSWGCGSSRLGLSLWVPHSGSRIARSRAFGHHAPNPSLKRTRHGQAFRAFISFWALHACPRRAA